MEIEEAIKLVEKFKNGQKVEAVEEIYTSTVTFVYKYVFSRIGKKEWVEDVVSETYATLIEVLEKYNGTSKIETFIIGIARNKINQYLSKLPKGEVEFEDDMIITVDEEVGESHDWGREKLMKVLNELNDNYRKVLECRFLESLSIRQTAEKMQESEANVRVLQNRALKKAAEIANNLFTNLNEI